jgi:pimeloyl-ACP methyl ester carboxylesterase
MGGLVVQRYLAEDGAGLAAALLAPVPLRGVRGLTRRMLRRYPLLFAEVNLTLRLSPVVRSPARVRALLLTADATDAQVAMLHARLQGESYAAYLGMLAPRLDPSRVRVPVLVLAGDADGIFTADELRSTAQAYGVELEVVPGASHELMLDPQWSVVARRLVAWADALPAGARIAG